MNMSKINPKKLAKKWKEEEIRLIAYYMREDEDVVRKLYEWANWGQLEEIRHGLKAGLDISVYAKPEYDDFQMLLMRKKMQGKNKRRGR